MEMKHDDYVSPNSSPTTAFNLAECFLLCVLTQRWIAMLRSSKQYAHATHLAAVGSTRTIDEEAFLSRCVRPFTVDLISRAFPRRCPYYVLCPCAFTLSHLFQPINPLIPFAVPCSRYFLRFTAKLTVARRIRRTTTSSMGGKPKQGPSLQRYYAGTA